MHNLDLQLEGIVKPDLSKILEEAHLPQDAYEVQLSNRTSGNTIVDLVVELSKIDLNALSVVIGYLRKLCTGCRFSMCEDRFLFSGAISG